MRKEFETHVLNEQGMNRARAIGQHFDELLANLEALSVGGDLRCQALMRTKLEEACFFAKKSMASSPDNQEVQP